MAPLAPISPQSIDKLAPPGLLYLHGLGSSPSSPKALAVVEHYASLGCQVETPNLRVPTLERLSFPASLATARSCLREPERRYVVIGSSLGGLTAARMAELEPRICGLVLLAPAFSFERLAHLWAGDTWDAQLAAGSFDVDDSLTGGTCRLWANFVLELCRLDQGLPRVQVPTLVVHGRQDPTVPLEHSLEWVRANPQAELGEVDDDHDLMADFPALLRLMERFTRRLGCHE